MRISYLMLAEELELADKARREHNRGLEARHLTEALGYLQDEIAKFKPEELPA